MSINHIVQRITIADALRVPAIDTSRGVYIYGAGELGLLARDYCEACHIPIVGFIDQVKTGFINGKLRDYLIVGPTGVPEADRLMMPILVAIATLPFKPIYDFLFSLGWENVFPFYNLTSEGRSGHPLGNGWAVGSVTDEEKDAVRFICDKWADAVSLAHYQAFLAWHVDGSEIPITNQPIDPDQRYVIAPILTVLTRRSTQMVDVGSHHGEAVLRLLSHGVEFIEYVLIEPDAFSRDYLEKDLPRHLCQGKKLLVVDAVLGASKSDLPFVNGLGYCSQLWSGASATRRVETIDSFGWKPDFLKIHTEGSELDVLMGAKETIRRHKPALAISVYHNRDGLCRIMAEAMRHFSGYTWYFRLHSYQGTGAFVYGVPN